MVKLYSGECTVSCSLDIVNTMMSYILYLCNMAISALRAIKWYLFCYSVDFNQKSLNYTVANAQSTVPNVESTVHWTLLTEWCLTSYISVYLCRMKLGIVTFDQCEMTAIKWCLFSYRLHFNQISLNYTVANAQSTVPNAQPTVHWTLLTEWCLTSYISVYLCRMKLGIVTFDQCEMTAIKWCLFSYRLHFNQISLNYTVANAQSTVPNAQPTVHWTL